MSKVLMVGSAEQMADSSWLSGKGMGYCMLIALCLNANRNAMEQIKIKEKYLKNGQQKQKRNIYIDINP